MACVRVASVALLALSLSLCTTVLSCKPPARSFTVSLIPRDSLNSSHSNTDVDPHFAYIQAAITRSNVRSNQFTSTFGLGLKAAIDPETDVIAASGEYLINMSLGTPPVPILAVADTGSDLTWTQCKPCSNCYKQNGPLFDTTKSSTYKHVSCSDPKCPINATGFNPSCGSSKKCQYSVAYGDFATTSGGIATDTMTIGPSKFPNILFGCGFDNRGTFSLPGSGIVGLGNGPTSLISQIDKSIGGKFSYCLVPLSSKGSKSSDLNFGKNAIVSGPDVVSTPMVTMEPSTYFYVTLEAITVENVRVPCKPSLNFGDDIDGDYYGYGNDVIKGNFIIDSGTTLLMLPSYYYTALEYQISKHNGFMLQRKYHSLRLCYNSSSFKAPEIVVNFEGADVKLNDYNVFIEVEKGVTCFAAAGAPSGLGIYGNLAQMNFLVGFDRVKKTVSFKPKDCGSHSNVV